MDGPKHLLTHPKSVHYSVHFEGIAMKTVSATEARKTFFELIKQTNQQHEIFEVHHKSGKAMIMSAEDYDSLIETLHILSQPDFNKTFEQSTKEADKGDTDSFEDVFGEPL